MASTMRRPRRLRVLRVPDRSRRRSTSAALAACASACAAAGCRGPTTIAPSARDPSRSLAIAAMRGSSKGCSANAPRRALEPRRPPAGASTPPVEPASRPGVRARPGRARSAPARRWSAAPPVNEYAASTAYRRFIVPSVARRRAAHARALANAAGSSDRMSASNAAMTSACSSARCVRTGRPNASAAPSRAASRESGSHSTQTAVGELRPRSAPSTGGASATTAGLGEHAQARPAVRRERREVRREPRGKRVPAPRRGSRPLRALDDLRAPVRVIQLKDGRLRHGVGGAEALRMRRVPLDLDRAAVVAGDEQARSPRPGDRTTWRSAPSARERTLPAGGRTGRSSLRASAGRRSSRRGRPKRPSI